MINLSMVSSVCFCASEAQELLDAVTYLNEQEQDVANISDSVERDEQEKFRAIQDELHTSAVDHRENGEEDQLAFPWVDSSNESEGQTLST